MERRAPKGGPTRDVFSVSPHSFRQTWDRAKVTLGLSDDAQLVPHALRHTTASRLVQRGVTLKVVQEWLGHKTITVTMRYAHLAPANLLAAVKVLEEE
jgi:site-specific recombinase XerD